MTAVLSLILVMLAATVCICAIATVRSVSSEEFWGRFWSMIISGLLLLACMGITFAFVNRLPV